MQPSPTSRAVIMSFGYGHQPGGRDPAADITVDLRRWFRDPHVSPNLRELTGRDAAVVASVLDQSGVQVFAARIAAATRALLVLVEPGGTVSVAVGCVGGRHRSVVVADVIAAELVGCGCAAVTVHAHIDRPVIGGIR
jgi:RNase adapter protein RapZ